MASKVDSQESEKECTECEDFPEFIRALGKKMLRAATEGHVRCMKAAMDAGADVNFRDEPTLDDDPYEDSDRNDDTFPSFDSISDEEKYVGPSFKTALILASENNRIQCVELLIKSGADVNQHDTLCYTALMAAAEKGNHEIMEMLIEAGSDVDMEHDNGIRSYGNALTYATKNGHSRCVEMLIKEGADLDMQTYDRENGFTALMLAVKYGFSDCVELLIEAGADVNVKDTRRLTAYDHAMDNNRHDCCQLLFNLKKDQ